MDGSHTHGPSGGGFAENVASSAAIVIGVIGGSLVLMWVLHILMIVFICVGAFTTAAIGGYTTVRLRRRRRRLEAGQALVPARRTGLLPRREEPPALGQGDGGMHLHIHGADAAEVLRRYLGDR